jgi:3-hydroxyisobutyrate dehydrogenase-like beta-hydroxyacid dehydrogenase
MNAARAPEGAKIGWIGLGKMGLPICERLAAEGFPVTALSRSAERRERATRAGVRSASGIVAAISDDAALLDIVFKTHGLKETLTASQIFVEISTVSPNASRRVAEVMAAIGVDYVRSPVSGSAALAAQGSLTAVVSGPPKAIERLAVFYEALVGDAEEARYLKLVLNTLPPAPSADLWRSAFQGKADNTPLSIPAAHEEDEHHGQA